MTRFERRLTLTPEAISGLTEDITAFLQRQSVGSEATFDTALIVEELLVNLSTHGKAQGGPAQVMLAVEPDMIKGEIVDAGAPFDPRKAPTPLPSGSLARRPIGGLGLHMIRQLTCTLDYRRADGANRTAFSVSRGRSRGDQE